MKRNSATGLTQLELMVSLAVMALIALTLANAMSFARAGLERSGSLSEGIAEAMARNRYRDLGESMGTAFGTGTARDIFEGSATQLAFRSQTPDPSGSGSVEVMIGLTLQSDDVIALLSLVEASEETSPLQPLTLAYGAGQIGISYYGQLSGEGEMRWHEDWSDTTYLPELVKIEIDKIDGTPLPPITFIPAKAERQRYMSLSSLLPPD